MAGQPDRSSTGQTGPMARRPAAGRPNPGTRRPARVPVNVDVDAEGSFTAGASAGLAASSAAPIPPDLVPREVPTQASYRLLISSGVPGVDAAALIGYVVGLPSCPSRWSLSQVNRLLFLRALYSSSDWGEAERRPA